MIIERSYLAFEARGFRHRAVSGDVMPLSLEACEDR